MQRVLDTLPALSMLVITSSLIWGALLEARVLAIALIAFQIFWVWRSYNTAYHALKGRRLIHRDEATDWRMAYERGRAVQSFALPWRSVRHVVVIPNYKESFDKLRATLHALASQAEAKEKLYIVLAMEAAEQDVSKKALRLNSEFAGQFAGIHATFHPRAIPGEVPGKGSNENWGARRAKEWIVDQLGHDLRHFTITSCDADTIFHPRYFEALTCKFALDPRRYRRFWQAPVSMYNNIWEVPAPLRILNCLGSLHHLATLSRRFNRMIFPQSTYSLSFIMADEVGYWDADVIPEDWHMFLKCYFTLGGGVDVDPIYLPLGMDGVRSHTYKKTLIDHYEQVRRHAWGATDFSYAAKMALQHPEIPVFQRIRRVWAVYESHVLWSTQWFIVSLPGILFGTLASVQMIPAEFSLAMPVWWADIAWPLMWSCSLPLVTLVVVDSMSRPARPHTFGKLQLVFQTVQWFAMGIITLIFNALPSVDAQFRMLVGRRLEYKVASKVVRRID